VAALGQAAWALSEPKRAWRAAVGAAATEAYPTTKPAGAAPGLLELHNGMIR
jgi:hypothetical protein